jgi:hypothetical protein
MINKKIKYILITFIVLGMCLGAGKLANIIGIILIASMLIHKGNDRS